MATCAPGCRCWNSPRRVRCTCATTSPACATTGRWRCCTARRSRRRSATPRPRASSPAPRTLQFAPGTRHSYVNQNFRILSDILQERTGRSFAELLRTRIFERAGMDTALLAADTRAMPDGTQGYEGTPTGGFRAAENRILWTGDAGLGA